MIEDLLSPEQMKTHGSRMRPYPDSSSDVMVEVKEVPSHIRLHGKLKMDDILDIGPLDNGSCNGIVE